MFLRGLDHLIAEFLAGPGHKPLNLAERLVGQAGRVVHVVPAARPFAGMLYGAITACKAAATTGHKEAPPGQVAVRRFIHGARWLQALIRQGHD